MLHSIILRRTGDFWIDLGLIGLWRTLIARSKHNPVRTEEGLDAQIILEEDDLIEDNAKTGLSVMLSSTLLSLKYEDDKILNQELSIALDSIKPNYLGKSKTERIWWQSLGRMFFSNQNPTVFFELPTRIINTQKGKWPVGVCDFCGTSQRFVKKAGAGTHPLVVVPGKFSSFYSNLIGDTKICNWCSFATKFSPLRLFYVIKGKSLTAIAMEAATLTDLSETLVNFSRLFAQSERNRNFSSVLNYTKYPLEGFLDFLFATIQEIEKKRDLQGRSILKSGIISKVHVIQGTSGQGLSIDGYYVIPNMPKVFDFISSCQWLSKGQKLYNCLFETAKSLTTRKGADVDTVSREEFARRLFYNKDISDLFEEFLISNLGVKFPLKFFVLLNIDKFIPLYVLNQMGMDSYQLGIAREIGHIIGELSAQYDQKSLLYNLRSLGNLDSLIAFINQLLVRYIDDIKQHTRPFRTLLDQINNMNWYTYKSLIGIYAALKYAELKYKKEDLIEGKEEVVEV